MAQACTARTGWRLSPDQYPRIEMSLSPSVPSPSLGGSGDGEGVCGRGIGAVRRLVGHWEQGPKTPARRAAAVGALQAQPDAVDHVGELRLPQVGVRVGRASLSAVVQRLDRCGQRTRLDL